MEPTRTAARRPAGERREGPRAHPRPRPSWPGRRRRSRRGRRTPGPADRPRSFSNLRLDSGRMVAHDVTAFILHPEPSPAAGALETAVAAARADLAERHRAGFLAAGAAAARVVSGPPDDTPFGRRLRQLAADAGSG